MAGAGLLARRSGTGTGSEPQVAHAAGVGPGERGRWWYVVGRSGLAKAVKSAAAAEGGRCVGRTGSAASS